MGSPIEKKNKYRSFIYGEDEKNTTWVFGAPPNYDVVDKLFEEGRTQVIFYLLSFIVSLQNMMHVHNITRCYILIKLNSI